jgi:predicted AAA+ superfamily ATPase
MKIPRDKYLQELQSVMHNGMIKIITGVRRCGKSYLLFELFKQSLLDNGVNEDHVIQVDLENRRSKDLRNPDTLLDYIDGHIVDNDMYYILLDEIQLVPEFEDVLNSYLKIKNTDVYVT